MRKVSGRGGAGGRKRIEGVVPAPLTENVTVGTASGMTASGSNSYVWFVANGARPGDILTAFDIAFLGAATGQLWRAKVLPGGIVGEWIAKIADVTAAGAGIVPVTGFAPVALGEGEMVAYKRLSGLQVATTPGPAATSLTGPNGSFTGAGSSATLTANTNEIGIKLYLTRLVLSRSPVPLTFPRQITGIVGYGQSYILGQAATPPLSTTPSAYDKTFGVGEKMTKSGLGAVATTDDGTIKALVEDTSNPSLSGAGSYGETILSAMCSEMGGRVLARTGVRPVFFGSVAGKGAQAIAALQPYADHYANSSYHIEAGKREAADLGQTYGLALVPVLHGQADQQAGTTKDNYLVGIERYVDRTIYEARHFAPGAPQPQFLFMTPGFAIKTSWGVTQALLELCERRGDCHIVTHDTRLPIGADNTHPTNVGQHLAGALFGRAGAELTLGRRPSRIWWRTATVVGTTVTVVASAYTPVEFNTTLRALTTDYGFKLLDDTGTLTLSGIAKVGSVFNTLTGLYDTTFTMTINRALGTNPRLRYALDYTAAGINMTGAATGNVFDTNTDMVTISGTPTSMALEATPYEWALAA